MGVELTDAEVALLRKVADGNVLFVRNVYRYWGAFQPPVNGHLIQRLRAMMLIRLADEKMVAGNRKVEPTERGWDWLDTHAKIP